MRRSLGRDVARGAAGGVAATVAMSAVMLGAQRASSMGRQAPKRITESALRAVGLGRSEEARNVATIAAHLAFGVGNGVAFSVARPRLRLPVPAVVQGVVFALGVWGASYQGWVPALGIMPPATRDDPARQATLIAGHVMFGAVLGGLEAWDESREEERRPGEAPLFDS